MTPNEAKRLSITYKVQQIREMRDRANKPDYGWDGAMETRLTDLEAKVHDELGVAGVLMFVDDGWWGWKPCPNWEDSCSNLGFPPDDIQKVKDYIMSVWFKTDTKAA